MTLDCPCGARLTVGNLSKHRGQHFPAGLPPGSSSASSIAQVPVQSEPTANTGNSSSARPATAAQLGIAPNDMVRCEHCGVEHRSRRTSHHLARCPGPRQAKEASPKLPGPRKGEEWNRRLSAYIEKWKAEPNRRSGEPIADRPDKREPKSVLKTPRVGMTQPEASRGSSTTRKPQSRGSREAILVTARMIDVPSLSCRRGDCQRARRAVGVSEPSRRFEVSRAPAPGLIRLVCAACHELAGEFLSEVFFVRLKAPAPVQKLVARARTAPKASVATTYPAADWWRDGGDPPPLKGFRYRI